MTVDKIVNKLSEEYGILSTTQFGHYVRLLILSYNRFGFRFEEAKDLTGLPDEEIYKILKGRFTEEDGVYTSWLKKSELKPKESRSFIPPSLSEVVEYFTSNGFSEQAAVKFFKYYSTDGKWEDAYGNKVRNWKQKAQAVWFSRQENKVQSKTIKIAQ